MRRKVKKRKRKIKKKIKSKAKKKKLSRSRIMNPQKKMKKLKKNYQKINHTI